MSAASTESGPLVVKMGWKSFSSDASIKAGHAYAAGTPLVTHIRSPGMIFTMSEEMNSIVSHHHNHHHHHYCLITIPITIPIIV
jgi:hypothetical protein